MMLISLYYFEGTFVGGANLCLCVGSSVNFMKKSATVENSEYGEIVDNAILLSGAVLYAPR